MAYNNLTREQQISNITNLKEMYESNNRLLISITQMSENLHSTNITNLINNLINSNNEIKNNIITLLNVNTNNRQHNNNRQNNYNRNNGNRQNYINNPTVNNLFHTFFDPIEIFPTPSQIESATRVTRFCDIITPLNSACPITLENFNDNDQVLMIRHCGHIFNSTGLTSWFRSNCRCPVCRYDIRNYVSINNISDFSGNVDVSSNVLSSSTPSIERSSNSNEFVELLLSNLLNNNISDLSGNNLFDLSGNNLLSNLSVPRSIYVTNDDITQTYATDISGNNLLQFFFRY